MDAHQDAMIKSLVAVAWADGQVTDQESEVIEALIAAFGLVGDDATTIREYAKQPRGIDDVPLTELSSSDRRLLLQQAMVLTYADGTHSPEERAVLDDLVSKLRVPADEAKQILDAAEERARHLVSLI